MARFLKKRWGLLVMLWAILIVALVSAAPSANVRGITLGTPVPTADGGLDVPVNLAADSGQEIAALQFDLHYDSRQYGFSDAASGGAATGAGKDAVVSETESGMLRVVVAGINQDTLASGTVATLHFERTGEAGSSPTFLDNATLGDVVASGPSGENIEGLDTSVAAPASTSVTSTATSNESNAKNYAVGGTVSPVGNEIGKELTGSGATGSDMILESGRGTADTASQRSKAGNPGTSLGSRESAPGSRVRAITPSIPLISKGVAPRQVLESPPARNSARPAGTSVRNKRQVLGQFPDLSGASVPVEETAATGHSSRVLTAGRSGGNLDQVSAARTGTVAVPLPAVAAANATGIAVNLKDPSNSGMLVLFAGGIATVLLLLLGAWAIRRN